MREELESEKKEGHMKVRHNKYGAYTLVGRNRDPDEDRKGKIITWKCMA